MNTSSDNKNQEHKTVEKMLDRSVSNRLNKFESLKKTFHKNDNFQKKPNTSSLFSTTEEEKLEKKKHIEFLDDISINTKDVTAISGISENPSISPSSTTKYYISYEGKLAVGTRKSKPVVVDRFFEDTKKVEIVTSILNEIFLRMEGNDEAAFLKDHQRYISNSVSTSSSPSAFQTTRYIGIRDRIHKKREELEEIKIKPEEKVPTKQKTQIPRFSSVVRHLSLPVNVSKPQPQVSIRTNYDRIMSEKDAILAKTAFKKEHTVEEFENEIEKQKSRSFEGEEHVKSPFELKWCFGLNLYVPVLNLSTNNKTLIMIACSQFSVLYDFHEDTMLFMQGHMNEVSCIACDATGSLMVSADCGSNSRVIIWDSRPCVVEVLQGIHPRGTQLVGLSASGDVLVTVSPFPDHHVQMWLWKQDSTQPAADKLFNDSFGQINKVTMREVCAGEFALTTETVVVFVYFEKKKAGEAHGDLQFDSHHIPPRFGTLTDTAFLTDQSASALTSTSRGYVIMWVKEEGERRKKIHQKHVRLHLGSITHVVAMDNMIAIATETGNVNFFSPNLTVLYWSKKLEVGPLVSLSFNLSQENGEMMCANEAHGSCAATWRKEKNQLMDASLDQNPFTTKHFVISTTDGRIGYFNVSNDSLKLLLYPSGATFTGIDVTPKSHYLCAGTSAGQVFLIDTKDFKIKVTRKISTPEGQCQGVSKLHYSPSGCLLAVGMYAGTVWLLDPLLLTPLQQYPLTPSPDCVTHIAFSPTENFLAVADTGQCVSMYALSQSPPMLLNQYQAHSKPIRDLFFVSFEDMLKLYTLGTDRNITEFHVTENNTSSAMLFRHVHRVEQTAIPHCIVPQYPPSDMHYLMVNSEMKFKLLDSHTLKCCKTFQAPDLGADIQQIELLNESYLVFVTTYHIALQLLPIDGNPYKALGYKCSSTPIVSCKVHPNGKYLFVISENCTTITMWKINPLALEEWHLTGGKGVEPFLRVLEGGKGGWREKDLRDFFLVGQFSQQGDRPSIVRTLSNTVSSREVVNIFQALGFFPTKYQIDNLMAEVYGSDTCPLQLPGGQQRISFDDLVQLYINHRPSHEISLADLRNACHHLYKDGRHLPFPPDSELIFNTKTFIEKLTISGEETPLTNLCSDLSTLMVGRQDASVSDLLSAESLPLPFMPKLFSFEAFVKDTLGFPINKSRTFSQNSNSS